MMDLITNKCLSIGLKMNVKKTEVMILKSKSRQYNISQQAHDKRIWNWKVKPRRKENDMWMLQ